MSIATSGHPSPIGYVIECRGAWVRAQIRSVATVIVVTGYLDETNAEPVLGHLCRFTTLEGPLIVDVNSADIDDNGAFERLLSAFGTQCRRRGIDWALIAQAGPGCLPPVDEQHVVRADSVAEALQHFVCVIHARRHMPLARKRRAGVSRKRVEQPDR
ncbi:hypothetical protein [Mycobacterium marseillense]|uniref:hypothetical protein n=1 Tax=Mycobacterium marseillense TaxID=701042 RepID=UPI00119CAB13|nr:hypothetical protein [Mycobacterium marseillense]